MYQILHQKSTYHLSVLNTWYCSNLCSSVSKVEVDFSEKSSISSFSCFVVKHVLSCMNSWFNVIELSKFPSFYRLQFYILCKNSVIVYIFCSSSFHSSCDIHSNNFPKIFNVRYIKIYIKFTEKLCNIISSIVIN